VRYLRENHKYWENTYQTACNHFEAEKRQHRVRCVDRAGGVTLVPTNEIQTENADYLESKFRDQGTGERGNLIQYPEAREV
jgi:hypothetical protein